MSSNLKALIASRIDSSYLPKMMNDESSYVREIVQQRLKNKINE